MRCEGLHVLDMHNWLNGLLTKPIRRATVARPTEKRLKPPRQSFCHDKKIDSKEPSSDGLQPIVTPSSLLFLIEFLFLIASCYY